MENPQLSHEETACLHLIVTILVVTTCSEIASADSRESALFQFRNKKQYQEETN